MPTARKVGTPLAGDGSLRAKLHLPFRADRGAAALDRRDRGRYGAGRADAAAAARRCRLGQDRGGAGSDADCGRGGGAGGAARADRNPRSPAFCDAFRHAGGNRRRDRAVHRARQGQGARIDPDGAARWQHPDRRRHPCDLSGYGRLQEPRAGGDRRAAPLRRRPAADADAEGQAHAALPGDDRHPDPAHADAGAIWRDGRQPPRRDAAGPPADRHPRGRGRADGAMSSARWRGIWKAASRPIGSARWSASTRPRTSPPPRRAMPS